MLFVDRRNIHSAADCVRLYHNTLYAEYFLDLELSSILPPGGQKTWSLGLKDSERSFGTVALTAVSSPKSHSGRF